MNLLSCLSAPIYIIIGGVETTQTNKILCNDLSNKYTVHTSCQEIEHHLFYTLQGGAFSQGSAKIMVKIYKFYYNNYYVFYPVYATIIIRNYFVHLVRNNDKCTVYCNFNVDLIQFRKEAKDECLNVNMKWYKVCQFRYPTYLHTHYCLHLVYLSLSIHFMLKVVLMYQHSCQQ